MNNILKLLIILALFTSCCDVGLDAEKADTLKAELNTILDLWHRDAANADLENYIVAMSQSGVFIGTDATERWTTAEFNDFCKPYFDSARTWEFHPLARSVYISDDGNTAWFDELLDTKLGLCRGSGVLKRWDNGWKIEQYVLSPTIPNELIKDVVFAKRETDSLIIERLSGKE